MCFINWSHDCHDDILTLYMSTDMEDRAAERTRLKKEREEKRRKAEEERLVCVLFVNFLIS